MSRAPLNEHDAQQGAESKGEFLGMTGNCAWYLFGALAATIFMVTILWGTLHVPLSCCLITGVALCVLALLYVFALKNNRPAHYDTDFFEHVLIEAGVMQMAFGPGEPPPANPFRAQLASVVPSCPREMPPARRWTAIRGPAPEESDSRSSVSVSAMTTTKRAGRVENEMAPTVPLSTYERLRDELEDTREVLDDALAEAGEGVCE